MNRRIIILVLAIFAGGAVCTLQARDSPFTRKGTGPRYWIAYEYCWVTNTPIPEDRWKANIDWVSMNFKSYGYDMICNDGWIEAAQTINKDGYITKYNDEWQHGFSYWADYLSQKEMKLGVYYNPLWMTKAAFQQNGNVKGTTIHTREIVGDISFNAPLYWIDVDKPGAKEWIQGYVTYFIETGAKYLRVDFLENYEKNYGTAKYIKALQWIKEAAGNDLFLSLVMPNCFDHGRNELKYGDMIRIDDDCFDGGWEFVSNRRRGEQKPLWPQYANAFDGFIGFADIGGRGQMILDGDFMRLNTMANDKERKFLFSLMVITGSALAIADQFDTIEKSAWIYQNAELLELNENGFVAKPLSYDHKDIEKSSIWAGQLPNGDWVVGLFNREETTQIRRIDFEKELGIEGGITKNVRCLWQHTDLGTMTGGYSVELEPHECQIIKIETPYRKYETEFASMINTHKSSLNFRYSGNGYVSGFDKGGSLLTAVEIPEDGMYQLQIRYGNSSGATATGSLYINDQKHAQQLRMSDLKNKNEWGDLTVNVSIKSGINYINIQKDAQDNGLFSIDFIQIQ